MGRRSHDAEELDVCTGPDAVDAFVAVGVAGVDEAPEEADVPAKGEGSPLECLS